jgi:hypothetical protein
MGECGPVGAFNVDRSESLGIVQMKLGLLLAILLLIAGSAFAINPFVGEWVVQDDHYYINDAHIIGIMDGVPFESDYTYTEQTWAWKDRIWIYRFFGPDKILLVGILHYGQGFAPSYWVLIRVKREEVPEA